MMKHSLVYFLLLFCLQHYAGAQPVGDVDKIKEKLFRLSLNDPLAEDSFANTDVANLLQKLDATGKWTDINYKDKTASKWQPAQHWQRLLQLATNYKNEKSIYYGDDRFCSAIRIGISYWLQQTPVAINYWWNAIGVPNMMGKVLILMQKELSDSIKAGGIQLIKLGVKPDHYEYHGIATGQNLLWLASAHLYAACLENDRQSLTRIFAAVADEIKITEEEGIQPDYSFYQHGRQNYALGYGKGFTATAVQYFYLTNETAFRFPQIKIDIIAYYLLQGQQWMTRYGYLEYTAMGREIARQKIDKRPLLIALIWMMDIDPVRRNQYEAFYKRLSGVMEEKPLIGNRYFWRSDLMIHQRSNYYFSLKAASNRISSGESGNGENIKGFYAGNGTYYLIRNGHEYKAIFPVWDWRKLPGLLAKQDTATLPLFTWGEGAQGSTSFVYGISDSLYGCFAYDYTKAGVMARRSWFLFDNEIVHLASGVTGDSVYQSINQCLLNGNVWKGEANRNSQKVFHDSVGYLINNNGYAVSVKQEAQTGAWKQINLADNEAPVTKNVFSLGIDLGASISDASYSYTILPAISLPQFKTYQLREHLIILQNSKDVQAVYQKDISQMQAVFFNAGKIQLPWNKLSLTMKQPGLVLIKKRSNKLLIDYSQPVQKQHLELTIDNKMPFQNTDIEISTGLQSLP